MDLWKLLILGVIAVGLLLILGRPPEPPRLPEGWRVEEGTFRLRTPAGIEEEIFGIYPVDAGFRVVALRYTQGKVLVEADLLYAPDWTPLAGTLTQRHPQEVRWIFVFFEEGVHIRKQIGAREFSEILALSEQTFPFDDDVLATWDALLRAGVTGEVSLLDVRNGSLRRVRIGAREGVRLHVLGRLMPAERYGVTWDDEELWIFRQGDLMVGLRSPRGEAFLVEILPQGIQEIP